MDLSPDSILKGAMSSGSTGGVSQSSWAWEGLLARGGAVDRIACAIRAVGTCATEAFAGVGFGRGPALPTLPRFSPELQESKCESGLPGDSAGLARWEVKTYFSEHCVSLILALPI